VWGNRLRLQQFTPTDVAEVSMSAIDMGCAVKRAVRGPVRSGMGIRAVPRQIFTGVLLGGRFLPLTENAPKVAGSRGLYTLRPLPTLTRVVWDQRGVTAAPDISWLGLGPRSGFKVFSSVLVAAPLLAQKTSASVTIDKRSMEVSLKTVIDYLKLHGFRPRGSDCYDSTLNHWVKLAKESGGYSPFFKYKLAAFFSSYLGNKLPPKPFASADNPRILIGGRAGRFVALQLKMLDSSTSFAYGILQLKKGLVRPTKKDLRRARVATFTTLTTKRKNIVAFPSPHCRVDKGTVKGAINSVVSEVLGQHRFSLQKYVSKLFAPSLHSNYLKTRLDFGMFGLLSEDNTEYGDAQLPLIPGPVNDMFFMSSSLVELNKLNPGDGIDYDEIFRESLRRHGVFTRVEDNSDVSVITIDQKLLSQAQRWYENALGAAFRYAKADSEFRTSLVALAEPLKVRVISKGPPWHYFLLKPIQDLIHKIMRKHPTFALTGEVVTADLLNKKFAHVEGEFCSVDYASATDLLDPELSEFCVDAIARLLRIPEPLWTFFLRALTGHRIQDPEDKGMHYRQVWGQLMGSVVSFPILCFINAAILRLSYEFSDSQWPCKTDRLSRLPLLVNGDDGLTRGSTKIADTWEIISPVCGLIPSVGKVYRSLRYFNINSASFEMMRGFDFSLNRIRQCEYVNFGLVNGMTRSSAGGSKKLTFLEERELRGQTLGSCHTDLLNLLPASSNEFLVKVHKLFERKNWKVLSSVRVPWYLPQSMGGLGLRPIWNEDGSYYVQDGRRFGPSDRDLLRARILSNRDAFQYGIPNFCSQFSARDAWSKFVPELTSRALLIGPEGPIDQSPLEEIFGKLDVLSYYCLRLSRGKSANALDYFERLHRRLDRFIKNGKAHIWEPWKFLKPVQRIYNVHMTISNSEALIPMDECG
jgi:hypothetical protein